MIHVFQRTDMSPTLTMVVIDWNIIQAALEKNWLSEIPTIPAEVHWSNFK